MSFIFVFVITAISLAVTYDTIDDRGEIVAGQTPAYIANSLLDAHETFYNAEENNSAPSPIQYTDTTADQAASDFQRFHFHVDKSGGTAGENVNYFITLGTFRTDSENAPTRYAIASILHELTEERDDIHAGAISGVNAIHGGGYKITFTCLKAQCETNPVQPKIPTEFLTEDSNNQFHQFNDTSLGIGKDDILRDGTPVILQTRTAPTS